MEDLAAHTAQAFSMVSRSFASLERTMHQHNITQYITPYDGSDSRLCRPWVSEVEKWALHSLADDEAKQSALFITAKKTVSDFIQRYFRTNANPSWSSLKKAVLANFANISDAGHALDELRLIKQDKDESLSVFLERLHSLSIDAFAEVDLNEPGAQRLAQRQLVSFFVEGLQSERVKRKILASECEDLDAAAKIARKESEIDKRMSLRNPQLNRYENSTHTAMEVDQLKKRHPCGICGQRNHSTSNCYKRRETRNISRQMY